MRTIAGILFLIALYIVANLAYIVALGPAEDGGYYAICCRRTHPAMFAGVAWAWFVDYSPRVPVLALFVGFMLSMAFRNVAYRSPPCPRKEFVATV